MPGNRTRWTDDEVRRLVSAALSGEEGAAPVPTERRRATFEVHQHMGVTDTKIPSAWIPAVVAIVAAIVAIVAAIIAVVGGSR